jgi:hypothetical protein
MRGAGSRKRQQATRGCAGIVDLTAFAAPISDLAQVVCHNHISITSGSAINVEAVAVYRYRSACEQDELAVSDHYGSAKY